MMPGTLKATDVAALLGVSVDRIQVRAAAGQVPGAWRTQGNRGHWRFNAIDIEAYVRGIKAGAAHPKAPKRRASPPQEKSSSIERMRSQARAEKRARRNQWQGSSTAGTATTRA